MPKTKIGKWTVGFLALFFVSFATLMIMAATGQQGGDTFMDNLYLGIPGILAAISAITAFITGVISIFKYKDRSIAVIVAAVLGFIVLFFLAGEFIFPH